MKKKLNKQLTKFLVFGFITATIGACNKDEMNSGIEASRNVSNSIGVTNGMLKFKDKQHLNRVLDSLGKLSITDIDNFTKQFEYTSYALDTLNDDQIEVTPDPVLARLVNRNASFQIGDTIVTLTPYSDILISAKDIENYTNYIGGTANKESFKEIPVKGFSLNKFVEPTEAVGTQLMSQSFQRSLQKSQTTIVESIKKMQSLNTTAVAQMPYSWYGEDNIESPEEYHGRPEKVILTVYSHSRSFGKAYGVKAVGQAYRKGGVFGSKKWRNDEIHTLTFTLRKVRNSVGVEVNPNSTATLNNQEEMNLIRSDGAVDYVTGGDIGFQDLDFSVSFRKNGNSSSPTRIVNYFINSGNRTFNKNW